MSRIEELPDEFDSSLNLNPPLPSQPTQSSLEAAAGVSTPFPLPPKPQNGDVPQPELPPQIESVRGRSTSEVLSMMNRTPLFMTSLEDASDGISPFSINLRPNSPSLRKRRSENRLILNHRPDTENIELDALRALQYEGTRAEIAQNFREQGNEMARAKRWKDGKEYYTKGLAALKQPTQLPPPSSNAKPSPPPDAEEEEAKKEKEIEEACYINRALCNLSLRSFSILRFHHETLLK